MVGKGDDDGHADGGGRKDTGQFVPKPPAFTPGGSVAPVGIVAGGRQVSGPFIVIKLDKDDVEQLAKGNHPAPEQIDKNIPRFFGNGDDADIEWNRDHVMVDRETGVETPPTGGVRFSKEPKTREAVTERATTEQFSALKDSVVDKEPASRDDFAAFKAGKGHTIPPEAQSLSEGFNEKSGVDR